MIVKSTPKLSLSLTLRSSGIKKITILSRKTEDQKFAKKIRASWLNRKNLPNLELSYDLIINCDANNYFSKKYFTRKIFKDYNNLAYTTIIKHEKLKNNTAFQIFSIYGPIA